MNYDYANDVSVSVFSLFKPRLPVNPFIESDTLPGILEVDADKCRSQIRLRHHRNLCFLR